MSPLRLTPQRLALAILAALAILITAQTTAYAAPTPTPKAGPTAARTAEPRTDPRYYYYVQYQEVVARNPWLGAYVDGTVRSMSGRMACGYDENYQTAPCWARHENGVADTDHAIRFPLGERYLTWIRQGSYPVGSAVTDSFCDLAQGGCGVHTTGGSVYWSPDSGTHWVRGAIKDRWSATGWENGFLGYPVSDEFCGLRNNGCGNHFQGGSIYWTADTGAWEVHGLFHQTWSDNGWENGWLGYPTGPEVRSGDVVTQQFQGGWLSYNFRTGQLQQNRR